VRGVLHSLALTPMKRSFLAVFLAGLLLAISTPKLTQAMPSTMPTSDPVNPYPEFIYPAQGVLTSGYGWRWGRMHKGIDIAAAVGTPIVASAEGIVIFASWNRGGYGNLIEISHLNGSKTLYAHNSRLLVHKGDYVEQGQVIAEMGSTGHSTGPHCHFEIHRMGKGAVNPIAYLNNPQY
jgi:murein DD-endopeptidase MepM/ murein hydrolase activator NlpD